MLIKGGRTMIDYTNPTEKLEDLISEKIEKTSQLKFAINDHISLKLKYKKESNDLLLNTDFKEATGESRPTVAMKEAYIENKLYDLLVQLEISKENVSYIKKEIELIDNYISLYEYVIQLELK